MFRNKEGGPDWEEFLQFLGTRIELANWDGYRGGLDVESAKTPPFSTVCSFRRFSVRFDPSFFLVVTRLSFVLGFVLLSFLCQFC